MQTLPDKLYSTDSIAQIERDVIENHHISGYTLMRRAGRAVLDAIESLHLSADSILVVCGAGNNAGDGYVVARLAKQKRYDVKVVSLIDPVRLKGDALQAYKHWLEIGGVSEPDLNLLTEADVIVDAVLGTGITRDLGGKSGPTGITYREDVQQAFGNWMQENGYNKRLFEWICRNMPNASAHAAFSALQSIVDRFKVLFLEHRGYEAQADFAAKVLLGPDTALPSQYGR